MTRAASAYYNIKRRMPMYKFVFFDFDGTVFDTVEGITKSARYALNKYGRDATLEELRCFAGPPLLDMYMEYFDAPLEEAQRFVDAFRERYLIKGLYECCIFPGITDLLSDLRDEGRKTAVTTLKPQVLAETLLERADARKLFDAVCGTQEEDGNNKKSDTIRQAMKMLCASPDEVVLIGDTKYDIYGAHECGVKAVGVRYGYAAPGELEAAGADVVLDDMQQLKAWLAEN